jgi:hypothetical protein
VKTLKFWAPPAVLVALWIAVTAFTISELATIGPALGLAQLELPRVRESKQHGVEARTQASNRNAIAQP